MSFPLPHSEWSSYTGGTVSARFLPDGTVRLRLTDRDGHARRLALNRLAVIELSTAIARANAQGWFEATADAAFSDPRLIEAYKSTASGKHE